LTRLRDGDVLGWSTVLGNSSYTSSAICITDVAVLQITSERLRQLVTCHPQTGTMVLDLLATAVSPRWKDSQIQVKELLRRGM
jgi:CRP-like cAMP-binding protein